MEKALAESVERRDSVSLTPLGRLVRRQTSFSETPPEQLTRRATHFMLFPSPLVSFLHFFYDK
jgi:hypothetical protein